MIFLLFLLTSIQVVTVCKNELTFKKGGGDFLSSLIFGRESIETLVRTNPQRFWKNTVTHLLSAIVNSVDDDGDTTRS